MRPNPLPEEIYRHFKGNLYQVKCMAWHSETGEPLVIYQALYGTYKTYARPLAMFLEEVDHVKYPEVTQKYRFEKINPEQKQIENTVESPMQTSAVEEESVEAPLDPKILEFLDARTYDEKLTILSSIHPRLTNDMIDIMSTATDIEIKPGNIEDRYEEFKSCLLTMQHFECNRLH